MMILIVIALLLLISVTYVVSYFFEKLGSFSVTVEQYDMVRQGLSLSESPEFYEPISRLNAAAIKDVTNISGDSIPANVDNINGSHNGTDYIAYTFYLKNVGTDTVTYESVLTLANVTRGADEAVRLRVYHNGNAVTYAKTQTSGGGPEPGTVEFENEADVCVRRVRGFAPGDIEKYTVVIWVEGDDPECVDAIIGGRFKAEMNFSIVES